MSRSNGQGAVLVSGEHEYEVRGAVEVADDLRVLEHVLGLHLHCAALCPAQDGARKVERGRGLRRAGDDEAPGELHLGAERVDVVFERGGHIGGDDAEVALEVGVLGAVGGELRSDSEELALEAFDDALHVGVAGSGAGEAEGGDGFVGSAVGLGAEIALGDASAVEEAGLAFVAVLRVDLEGLAGHFAGIIRAPGDVVLPIHAPARCGVGRRSLMGVERG